MRSDNYWQSQALHFSRLYEHISIINIPQRIVAAFLAKRTSMLLQMVGTKKNMTMLDLGCGSGAQMQLFLPNCRHITGLDYSTQMLTSAKKLLRFSPKKKWRLIHGNAEKLPFKASAFDTVLAMGLIDYVSSPEKVFSECFRVLKSDGVLVVSIPKYPSLFSVLRSRFGDTIKNYVFHLPPISNTMTNRQATDILTKTGFRITSMDHVWGAMWMIRAVKNNK